jgi:hypothetical protein
MSSDATPNPVPVAPEEEPEQIFPSATGVVVPDDTAAEESASDTD